ncbi:MAG: large conductance mechanosensitive channel protein MscL [Acidobacteriota bacterium]|nr:large conductance mechanosensitive channel protein MscL [Acidobacteriota bacterium]
MFKGFRDFILRGSVVDLAVAFIMGAAFNAIVASLVGDVLNPLIAATIGKPDFGSVILHVGGGQIKVGNFFNALVSFLIVAAVVYFAIVAPMNALQARLKKPAAQGAPATKACPECLSEIPLAARRCAHCSQPVA